MNHLMGAKRPFAVGVVDEEVECGVGAHEDVGQADYDVAAERGREYFRLFQPSLSS